ncbi:hypothetical protein [Prosthecobacter fluviatilis]|uniref:TonB family C-terminal domain-containing protein n=1 Tax=Prosthecobacter fluviatilis TaxID=445931 RepID=A0ABW0KWX8_9BACT
MSRRIVNALWAALVVCLLAACSAPTKEEVEAKKKWREGLEWYLNEVYGLTQKSWANELKQRPNSQAHGYVRVNIALRPDGRLEQIHVKNNQDTDPVLTKFTVKAIQAIKFPAMPAEILPWVNEYQDGHLIFPVMFRAGDQGRAGAAANREKLSDAEVRKLMEKRWGMWMEKGRRKTSPMKDEEINVSLTAQESGARQTQPPAKADAGKKTTVKLTQTPKERYIARVRQAVETKWQQYRRMELAGVTYGSLKVEFYVNKKGGVEDVRVVDDTQSYRELTLFTLRAIKDAEIPAMPADVIPFLPTKDPERLKIDYHVLIY